MCKPFKNRLMAVVVVSQFFGTLVYGAGQRTGPSSDPSPVVVEWAPSGEVIYFQGEKKITSSKDLHAIIDPLNDPLAVQLLNKSEDQETIGTIGLIGGMILIGAGLTMSTLDIIGHNGWDGKVDAETAITVLSGSAIDVLSLLVLDESTTSKFTSVERYNQVVKNEPGLSFFIQGNHNGGLNLALKF